MLNLLVSTPSGLCVTGFRNMSVEIFLHKNQPTNWEHLKKLSPYALPIQKLVKLKV